MRGDIARSYFYIEGRYDLKISTQNRKLYEVWARQASSGIRARNSYCAGQGQSHGLA
ncbi:hypothetical protein [Zhongshania sp.]|uniref:hypothetical protein n=1 Tax=Zhongshania sp. TaxID=1971902 RepID=UPI003457645D